MVNVRVNFSSKRKLSAFSIQSKSEGKKIWISYCTGAPWDIQPVLVLNGMFCPEKNQNRVDLNS